ncbi:YetF domain-containing protein [Bacillus sp. CGMCC 1.16541]|uniref:DUF421 domain-containing protein n=1 Tax=Bacillus sp. CGMCC 1.16541 TaxID=2185143 RepID=UPI000D732ACE|nr:YetF domain-containing protein [Bacillus sp. CGMCC 1.16541]
MLADLLIYFFRAIIVVLGTWLVTNFIGKKSIAQLSPYEVAILFIISNVAAQPLVSADTFKTAFGVIVLGLILVFVTKLSMWSTFYGLNARPSILVQHGHIDMKQLKLNGMTVYSLLSMLRAQGFFKLSDVNYAILEPGGSLSVLPMVAVRPVTTEDLKLTVDEDELMYAVIIQGQILEEGLQQVGKSKEWLLDQLKSQYDVESKQVIYAEAQSDGTLYINI